MRLAAWAARALPGPIIAWLYRAGPLADFIRAGLNRAAPHGLAEVEVAAGELAGMRILLDLQTEKDYWLGTYEPELQEAIRRLVKPGMVVYDVGANIGYISLMLARRAGKSGRVYAFEALLANLERLRDNLALNKLEKEIVVVPGAVVDKASPVRFLTGPSDGMGKAEGSAGRNDVSYGDAIEVRGIALDVYAYEEDHLKPDLVKMDIEGGEVLALAGMQRVLHDVHPVMLVELHGPRAARAAWDNLVGAGYRICQMAPGFPPVVAVEALDWKAYLVALPEGWK